MGYRESVLSDSPTSLWMLDEPSTATTFVDAAGGNTGSYSGTSCTIGASGLLPGRFQDRSLSFSGTPGRALITDRNQFSPQTAGLASFEGLGLLTSLGASTSWLMTKGAASNYEWALGVTSTGFVNCTIWAASGANVMTVGGATTVSLNAIHHFAAVYNRSTPSLSIYLDGVLDGTTSTVSVAGGDVANGTADLHIGARGDDAASFWQGRIAGVALYATALSAARIAAHYRESVREGVSY